MQFKRKRKRAQWPIGPDKGGTKAPEAACCYFALPLAIQVERKARPRLAGEARGLPPEKALELYLDIKQVPAERKAKLLDYGRRLLREELEGM